MRAGGVADVAKTIAAAVVLLVVYCGASAVVAAVVATPVHLITQRTELALGTFVLMCALYAGIAAWFVWAVAQMNRR